MTTKKQIHAINLLIDYLHDLSLQFDSDYEHYKTKLIELAELSQDIRHELENKPC